MGRRILNDALRTIVNAERRERATVNLQPVSTTTASFLKIMKHRGFGVPPTRKPAREAVQPFLGHRGYIKDFEVFDPQRVGKITVNLLGRVIDCKALTYRQDIKAKEIEEYRLRMLPTRQWGYVVISTPNGVLDHEEAIRQNVGGQILGYFH